MTSSTPATFRVRLLLAVADGRMAAPASWGGLIAAHGSVEALCKALDLVAPTGDDLLALSISIDDWIQDGILARDLTILRQAHDRAVARAAEVLRHARRVAATSEEA